MALERGATAFVTETDTVVHDPKTAGKKTSRKGKCDRLLFAAVILLAVVGICMVLSTSHYTNLLKNKTGIDAYKPFISQLIYCVLGVGIMVFLCSMKDYVWIRKWSRLLWWVGIVLLVLVLISPSEANGAGRWIKLGPIQIQPAEFVKYFVLVSVAAYLQKHPKPTLKRFIMILLMTVIPALLIFMQKALSMTIVVLLMCYCVLLISGTDAAKMSILTVVGIVGGVVGVLAEEFRRERVLKFIHGEWTDQTRQSIFALANGGLGGQGIGGSRQKYGFLPEDDTDFIFSIFAEERGFIFVVLLIAVYAFIIWRGIKIAMKARCRFGAYLAFGITIYFALQAIINMAVASNVIPVTGQTLPFVSRGGSSLLANFAAFGILLNISRDVYG